MNEALVAAGEAEPLSSRTTPTPDDLAAAEGRRGRRPVGGCGGPYPPGPAARLSGSSGGTPTLAERLGYAADARLLIVNCDDLGSSHAANVGSYEALRDGLATSASLMVPCPWAREAAARYRGEDVGVHLTLNAEYDLYRWGPITQAPSLHDGDGGFPRTVEDLWDHADLDEVRRELPGPDRAGHPLGLRREPPRRHMGDAPATAPSSSTSTSSWPSSSACRCRCPAMPSGSVGFPLAAGRRGGRVCPTTRRRPQRRRRPRRSRESSFELRPGVTELLVTRRPRPPELRPSPPTGPSGSTISTWSLRTGPCATACRARGVTLIGYRALRDLQRAGGGSRELGAGKSVSRRTGPRARVARLEVRRAYWGSG